MRALFFSLLFFVTCLPTITKADEIKTTSVLTAATVYADRAALTREAEVTIPAGKHVIIFNDLTTRLYADSLRIEGNGTTDTILGALSHKIINNTDLISEREKALNDQKKALENKKKSIDAQKAALAAKRDFLKSLQARATGKTNDEKIAEFNLNTQDWLEAANTIGQGVSEVLQAELAFNLEIEQINKEIAKIQQDLGQLRTGQKQSYEVRLPIESKTAGKLKLSLSYQLPGASWRPIYDARLNTQSSALELIQYGSVSQRTGEDWSDIELTLSTARPHRGATAPTLHTMWVDIMRNYAKQKRSSASMGASLNRVQMEMAEADFADGPVMAAAPMPRELKQNTAQIDTSGLTAEFIIPGLSSVPADGTQSKVLITPFETDSKLQVHIKPQQNTSAYLIANTTIKGEVPILPGSVSLFRDGAYVGKTNIPLLRSGKDYDLSFGIDDQIEVTHKTLKDEAGESGILIGKNKTMERSTITEIQNLRNSTLAIVVMQTIPVSKNEEIKIAITDKNTTNGYEEDHDNIKGLLTWSFDLGSKEQKDINLGWNLSWPKDKNITGL